MDGFEPNEGIIVIAATNRPDVLDPALLRPGRFDRQVVVPRPDVRGREEILKVHTRDTPLNDDVNLATVARATPGFSGADLENLVNEAALHAARVGRAKISMLDFEYSKDKVLMGVERKSLIISDAEKKITAYHEGGHALVAKLTPGTDPIHKVTIIPRGLALGVTQQLPVEDKYTLSKAYLNNTITVLLGGRAAEEIIFGEQTSGAGNDLERATEIARKMICEWGMSDKVGPVTFGKREEQIFLGKELARHKDYSEATALEIDREIKRVVTENYKRAKTILEENIDLLHKLAEALLEREVVDGKELDDLVKQTRSAYPSWESSEGSLSAKGAVAMRTNKDP
jgi:cell division protease FtsH